MKNIVPPLLILCLFSIPVVSQIVPEVVWVNPGDTIKIEGVRSVYNSPQTHYRKYDRHGHPILSGSTSGIETVVLDSFERVEVGTMRQVSTHSGRDTVSTFVDFLSGGPDSLHTIYMIPTYPKSGTLSWRHITFDEQGADTLTISTTYPLDSDQQVYRERVAPSGDSLWVSFAASGSSFSLETYLTPAAPKPDTVYIDRIDTVYKTRYLIPSLDIVGKDSVGNVLFRNTIEN